MIQRELKRNPLSLYYVGETVLVRVAKTKKPVKGKKTALRGTCKGLIFKVDHDLHRYYVVFEYSNTAKQRKIWVKVDDITSLTKDEEKRRQDTAKKQNNKPKRLSPDNCASTPSNSKHVKPTNDVNLLDGSIANVLSFEKLKGDTINLYFDKFFVRDRCLNKKASLWQVLTFTPLLISRKICRHAKTMLEKTHCRTTSISIYMCTLQLRNTGCLPLSASSTYVYIFMILPAFQRTYINQYSKP